MQAQKYHARAQAKSPNFEISLNGNVNCGASIYKSNSSLTVSVANELTNTTLTNYTLTLSRLA